MDTDWTKIATLVIALFGLGLGLYNLRQARRDQAQKAKHGYAMMLLSLEPILEQMADLPLRSPADLTAIDVPAFCKRLEEIDASLHEAKKDLITLTPELAAYTVDVLKRSRALRTTLSDPSKVATQAVPEVTLYFKSCYALATFRRFASDFDMKLADQTKPSIENWHGDPVIHDLSERWKSFSRAKRP